MCCHDSLILILCISDMVMYQSSNSTDSCQNADGFTSDVRKHNQHSACSNESENNDHSDSDISSSSCRSETSSPTNDVQNQTESQCLIPDYKNQPDPDDICGLQWGNTFDIFLLLVDACTHELRHDQFIY